MYDCYHVAGMLPWLLCNPYQHYISLCCAKLQQCRYEKYYIVLLPGFSQKPSDLSQFPEVYTEEEGALIGFNLVPDLKHVSWENQEKWTYMKNKRDFSASSSVETVGKTSKPKLLPVKLRHNRRSRQELEQCVVETLLFFLKKQQLWSKMNVL